METNQHTAGGWECRYEAAGWRCKQPSQPTIWLLRDENFLESPSAREELDKFAARLTDVATIANRHALQSVYAEEIETLGGLDLEGVVVEAWEDFRVWFRLIRSHRMIAVRLVDGLPIDVFCEHP